MALFEELFIFLVSSPFVGLLGFSSYIFFVPGPRDLSKNNMLDHGQVSRVAAAAVLAMELEAFSKRRLTVGSFHAVSIALAAVLSDSMLIAQDQGRRRYHARIVVASP